MVWHTHSFPEKTRADFALALACRMADDDHSKQSGQPVNKKARHQSLNGIPEHGQRKAEARALIVNAVRHACEAEGAVVSVVMEDFAALYRKRQAPVPGWVYDALPSVSRCGIRLWMQQIEQGGVRRLAKQHERRAPRNIIENTPQLHDFVLGMLYEFPHTSAAGIERGLIARFGPEGTAPDPSIKLPSLRRIQAWLKGWKKANEQLLLAHTNPDASRSKHKAAFGDAAAHIKYPNQEWQSDGTLCELMLNDNRRHTLNLTLDVYSRRMRFHVSRTSSAAAVASGVRKAIIAWGIPDTWKTDNGKDYDNAHMQRVCVNLDIHHELCPPFSPEKKPFVERAFKTFLHSHVELLAGYLGHNVAERKAIESRKSFANRLFKKLKTPGEEVRLNLSPEELQKVCDDWAEYVYGNTPHSGIDGMTPNQKAAAYDGVVKHIPDERALDVLLLPVPGKDGIRTVTKKGLRIAREIGGLKIKGHYFSTDTAALMGQQVFVRFDDVCPGRVLMFTPDTHDYLGTAENPVLMGWTQEDVRNVAVASERTRKAVVAAEKKAWREAAKRADVVNIGNEIIATAKRKAALAAPAPAHESVVYTTPALEQATRARIGDFTALTAEEHAAAVAKLERMLAPEPTGFVIPIEVPQKLEVWRRLYDRRAAGESLEAAQEEWFWTFAKTTHCKIYCKLHGLVLAA